ncbi:MAG: prepilin-type N-terminal cleavage/methylation domain-containing protein [Nitrospira sp.]|jgi:general secretion pathway protein G|nr:prepilin-type N-terminal cleavage/methylation domain-containing protein [Nitrospira sp.]
MAYVTRCRTQQGFTIIELMIAVTIVGALAGLAIPNYLNYLDKARLARCIAEIRYIERVIDSYEAANELLPNTLAEVGAGEMVDPWGNPYAYLNIAALTLPGSGSGGGSGGTGGSGGAGGSGGGGGGGGSVPASSTSGGKKTSYWFEPTSAYAANSSGGGPPSHPRKDRFLHPINSDYDLYSMGKDGESMEPLTARKSHDDVIRANDGSFVGLAVEF